MREEFSKKGKIILNPELIKAPRGCIEYGIIHELYHLIHHDTLKNSLIYKPKKCQIGKNGKLN
jgi:hypothetical protein